MVRRVRSHAPGGSSTGHVSGAVVRRPWTLAARGAGLDQRLADHPLARRPIAPRPARRRAPCRRRSRPVRGPRRGRPAGRRRPRCVARRLAASRSRPGRGVGGDHACRRPPRWSATRCSDRGGRAAPARPRLDPGRRPPLPRSAARRTTMPGRAEPALAGAGRAEGLRPGPLLVVVETLDRGDRPTGDATGRRHAGHTRRAVDQHRAAPALALGAAPVLDAARARAGPGAPRAARRRRRRPRPAGRPARRRCRSSPAPTIGSPHVRAISRRTFLLTTGGAVLLSACGSDSGSDGGAATTRAARRVDRRRGARTVLQRRRAGRRHAAAPAVRPGRRQRRAHDRRPRAARDGRHRQQRHRGHHGHGASPRRRAAPSVLAADARARPRRGSTRPASTPGLRPRRPPSPSALPSRSPSRRSATS